MQNEPVEDELSKLEAFRFLQQATFGASDADIAHLLDQGISTWLVEQVSMPIIGYTERMLDEREQNAIREFAPKWLFWERAIHGDDQLRQRMAYALSQITVASLFDPQVVAYSLEYGVYADILQDNALGNYCQLVREVSFNPVMGLYLTHLGNRKADEQSGFVPDENYAREVMQLFTIGLEELDGQGRPVGRET